VGRLPYRKRTHIETIMVNTILEMIDE